MSGPSADDQLEGAPVPELKPEQPTNAARAGSLKHKTATSILWTVVRTGSDYFFSFLVFAVLARKLGPRAFGVFALAAAFAELVRILPTAGFTSALQRAKSISPEMADTVLWASLAVASLGAAALALLAEPIGRLVGEPAVAPLLVGLALTLPISAGGGTHIALMLHDFGHKAMASRSVGSNLIGGAAGLAAAWGGWGAWSLVVQRGVTELVGTLMAWQAYPWWPGFKFSTRLLRELSGYSLTMTYNQVLHVALVRVQDVIVGRFIDTAAVGQYRTAWRTVELISQGAIMPFTQVALPTLGRLQDDMPAFRKAYLRITAVCSAVAVPAIVGFAVVAPDAIPLVFGPEWGPAAPVAQVLGLMAVPFTHNRFAGPALATLGRYTILARFTTLQLVLTVALSILAAPYGLVAVAGAYVARVYLMLPLQMWVFQRYSGLRYGEILRSVAPAFATSALMAAAVVGLDAAVGDALRARHLYLVTAIPMGALVYLG
ncbi:MAG TPA: oligosaccharide flippase family protein, partial [Gemmatimonadales bacterium]|nr:oligosaccharide flippase family protein [Gemmatimonadales bacterium]